MMKEAFTITNTSECLFDQGCEGVVGLDHLDPTKTYLVTVEEIKPKVKKWRWVRDSGIGLTVTKKHYADQHEYDERIRRECPGGRSWELIQRIDSTEKEFDE